MGTAFIVPVDEVVVGERRPLAEDSIKRLMQSIKEIGLQHPITVRSVDGEWVLVAGNHRLEAFRRLGRQNIDAIVVKFDEIDAELWEISENLHRAELTALQRSEQIARWIELTKIKLAQLAPVSGGRGHEGGLRAASRELGVDRRDAQRAEIVASLTDEAKDAAREAGLDDNRSALLEAAKADPQRQATIIRDMAEAKAAGRNKIDRDVAERAIREAASIIIEYIPAEYWDGLKANLYAGKCGALANEISNITGQSIMDRRFG